MGVKEITTQLLTESDNRTHDVYRYLAVAAIAIGLGLNIYTVIRGEPFDIQGFGIGVGSLFTGVGIALSLKKESQLENSKDESKKE